MSYSCHIVLDLEFNPTVRGAGAVLRDEIIEIGAIKLDSEYRETGRFACFVKPRYNSRISPSIVRLTGITDREVKDAPDFAEAMELFSEWIGEERCRIYSWSNSDLIQMRKECEAKGVEFPVKNGRWMDLQRVWQRMSGLSDIGRLSLKRAAGFCGISFDDSTAHRAMYDTEITSDILMWLKLGFHSEAKKSREKLVCMQGSHMSSSIGSLCPGLGELLGRLSA